MTTTYTPLPWAFDSNHNELDPQLKAAQELALKDHLAAPNNNEDAKEEDDADQIYEPLILRNLLSAQQIDKIIAEASIDGVWPRGVDQADRAADDAGEELRSVPHHFAWAEDHVVLYMHNQGWFVEALPSLWCVIRGAMESRPWMNGGVPVLDERFAGSDQSMNQVRTIELHHYSAGGGLLTPGHRDTGSDLTISVLLSDPVDVSGGDFVTYDEGVPSAHKMGRGDAILFNSEDLHNISTVTGGVRQSLVVELYPSYQGD
jgi:hypothetical protein